MATVNVKLEVRDSGRSYKARWEGFVANGDVGNPISLVEMPDKTVQVYGSFGTGGSVTVQGSADGTNWATLHDPQGANLTFVAAGAKVIAENPEYIRIAADAGSGADIDIHITASR